MEKNEILKEANEALQRTLLMMNYDMKKTLTENVDVISEQATSSVEKGIANDIIDAAVRSAGTDEEGLRDAINKITSIDLYNKVNTLLRADEVIKYQFEDNPSIVGVLNGELGSGDLKIAQEIANHLKTIGVNVKVTPQKFYDNRTGKNGDSTTDVAKIELVGTDTKKQETGKSYYTGVFSCIEKNTSTQEDTYQNQKIVRVFSKSSLKVYWADEHYTEYVYDPSTKKVGAETGRGNFKCKGTTKTETKGSKKPPVATVTDKNILSKLKFDYQFPGDKSYTYAYVEEPALKESENISEGTWYAKSNKTGKIFDISKNYPQTAQKLNTQFPNAGQKVTDTKTDEKIPEPQGAEKPTPPSAENLAASQPPQKESLKKSLKNNLMEIKEKKENLMVETNIVEKRFNFIVEGKTFSTVEDQDELVESIISEIGYLKIQGYSSKAINEGLFSMFGSLLGGGAKAIPAVFGEYIANWLTGKLGIPKNSYMNAVIVSLVGNLNISDYDRFFSDCRFASNKIADSLIEGYLLQLQNQKDVNSGASGFIVSALRNSVVDYFAEDKNSLIQILEDKIGEFLCPKLSKLSAAISDKTDEVKAKMVA